jgi:hypothetical protein
MIAPSLLDAAQSLMHGHFVEELQFARSIRKQLSPRQRRLYILALERMRDIRRGQRACKDQLP